MRAIKIIIIIFLVIFAAAVIAGVIFIKTFDINRYKPQIIAAARSALGRALDFDSIELNVSLTQGVRVAVNKITVGEHPDIGTGDFLTVQRAYLGVDVLAFLLQKRIAVVKAQLTSPHLTIIRIGDGRVNAQMMPPAAAPAAAPGLPTAAVQPAAPAAFAPAALPAVSVDAIEVTDAGITYIDRTFEPAMHLEIKQLALRINDFSFEAPFPFSVAGAVFGGEENFRIEGRAQIDPKTFDAKLTQVKSAADLGKFSLDEIRRLPVIPKDAPFPEVMEGTLDVLVKELTAGAAGLKSITADLQLDEGKIIVTEAAPGVSFAVSQLNAGIKDFSLGAPFQWNVSAAYLNSVPNVSMAGSASFDLPSLTVKIFDAQAGGELASFSLAQLKEAVSALQDAPLPDELGGRLLVTVKAAAASPQGLTQLNADVQWSDGRVVFHELAPGVGLTASQANINVRDFSLSEDFQVDGSLAYLSDKPNISFTGKGNFDMPTGQIHLRGLEVKTDLSSFSMEQLRQSAAALKDTPLPQSLKGGLDISLRALTAGPAGLISLDGSTDLLGGQITLKELAAPVDQLNAKLEMSESAITLPESSLHIGQGKVSAQGQLEHYWTTQDYHLMTKMESLSIMAMIDQKDFPVKVQGIVNGGLEFSGRGFDPNKMLDALKGQGDFTVTEGKLTDINILKLVLDQLNFIPNLRQTLEDGLPPRYKEKLQQKDTVITAAKLNLGVGDGAVALNAVDIEADGFLFTGTGKAGFDQTYDFEGAFIIPQDLTQSMSMVISELELLYDEQGRIRFPLKVSGKGAAVKFMPDVKAVTTNAIKNKGREELQKVLDKVFDRDEPPAEEAPAPTEPGTEAPQKTPEQILIDSVLDSIFK